MAANHSRRFLAVARAIRGSDRRVAAWAGSQSTSAQFDRAMVDVSSLANHGKLWIATAAVLALTGHRSAATHGIVSLGIASASANLIGKRVFGGSRPLLRDIPLGRRLPEYPTSTSFPSGHSASAFAFAVGASIEDRRLSVVLVPMATVVAYSRLHTGAHWLSDVLGGVLLGTSAAVLEAALHRGRRTRRRSRRATR